MARALLAISAAISLVPATAHATTAIDYNVVVKGNFTAPTSDTEGRIAAGGNISVGSYSIGYKAQGGDVAIAGGTFNASGGGTAYGDTLANNYTGYSAPGQYQFTVNGTKNTYATATSPIDIASEMSRLTALSSSLYTSAATYGSIGNYSVDAGGNLTLYGTSGTVNIFNISNSMINAGAINISIPTGSVAVINVSGLTDSIKNTGGTGYSDTYAASILWNFYEATSLTLSTAYGTLLAPNADIYTTSGAIDGQVFANSFTGHDSSSGGTAQINLSVSGHNDYFANTALLGSTVGAVPEPATWAMMLIGFGTMGFSMRRWRRDIAAALTN